MAKSTVTYWNPLASDSDSRWEDIEGFDGKAQRLTLAFDRQTGDYTRLTKFADGVDTSAFGSQCHDYPEEILMLRGRLYDGAFDRWLEPGDYASRPPGEVHGPFKADGECIVLEISYPSQARRD